MDGTQGPGCIFPTISAPEELGHGHRRTAANTVEGESCRRQTRCLCRRRGEKEGREGGEGSEIITRARAPIK